MPASILTPEAFANALIAAVDAGKTVTEFAASIGTDSRAVQRRRARMIADGTDLPEFERGSAGVPGRIDQTSLVHHESWTAEDCLESLRKVQAEDEKKWITARYYAHHTGIRDTTWNRYFGTFEEFCRQAGMGRIRQLSQFGKQIAKHVSVDHYRSLNSEREGWGDAYLRPGKGRFRTILGANDLHDEEVDPFWLRVFLDTASRAQPDVIVLNGDTFDLPEFGKYNVDPRTWNVVGRIKYVHQHILRPLREACPSAQLDMIEGNHEYRLVRAMADANPAMMSLLSDLHGMDVATLFGLKEFEVNYVAKADLAAYRVSDVRGELARNWRIYYDCVLAHHFPEGKRKGLPGWNGHHHSHIAQQASSPVFGVYEWHQVGSGHRRDATYCDGEAWGNGFILWHVDTHTKATVAEYVPVTDFAMVGGRFYKRRPDECWHDDQRRAA